MSLTPRRPLDMCTTSPSCPSATAAAALCVARVEAQEVRDEQPAVAAERGRRDLQGPLEGVGYRLLEQHRVTGVEQRTCGRDMRSIGQADDETVDLVGVEHGLDGGVVARAVSVGEPASFRVDVHDRGERRQVTVDDRLGVQSPHEPAPHDDETSGFEARTPRFTRQRTHLQV